MRGATKEKLSYGVYMKALSKVEKTRLNRGRDRWNTRFEQFNNDPKEPEHHGRMQAQQVGLDPYENEPRSN